MRETTPAMNDAEQTTGSFRWVLAPSAAVFLILAIQQSYVVMTHTPRMLDLFQGFGADLPTSTAFAAEWYWLGCMVTVGITLVATGMVFLKARSSDYRPLKLWYLTAIAGVIATLLWSAFITRAMYAPIFEMGRVV